ncbi:TIGR04149 family rSAM-modified RiPP [Aquimarina sp. Aq78]|uniref:TIGR04149 family rSAM-modified RiPP n=1 Tax=Aquimarina sp. Aq78 TaxID=1191889 RepID=UPI000D0F3D07|nr:TIGR04149 family rSAM-modified RiPP [Aquimarina sp. Aq78]
MKNQKSIKKLNLKKITIVELDKNNLTKIFGGSDDPKYTEPGDKMCPKTDGC